MFAVYHVHGKTCDLVNSVGIAGILCAHISSTAATIKPRKSDPMPWKLSGHNLCCAVRERFGFEEAAASYKVVADVTFGRSDALIFEINVVWGFSYSCNGRKTFHYALHQRGLADKPDAPQGVHGLRGSVHPRAIAQTQ
jgi:hypothetical protein